MSSAVAPNQKGKKATGWKPLGSDKEIAKENPPALWSDYDRGRGAASEAERRERISRTQIHFTAPREVFVKRRKELGHNAGYVMKEAMEDSKDVRSTRDVESNVLRLECDMGVQAVTENVSAETQTPTFRRINACFQADPPIIDARIQPGKEEPTIPKPMKRFFDKVLPRMLHHLTLNDMVPIHGDDYVKLTDEDTFVASREENFLREAGNFHHMHSKGRHITSIDWRPGSKSIVCLSCIAPVSLAERAQLSCLVEPSVALVWNFADPMHPLCVLEAPSEVLTIKFNPSRPHLIVGGCMNGQILLWDISHALEAKPKQSTKTRAPQNQQEDVMHIPRMQPPLKGHTLEKDGDSLVSRIQPCQVSRAEFGHKRAVHDICWLPESLELDFAGKLEPGQDHNQFASISEDGTMMIWDLRPDRLSEKQKKMKKNKSKGGPGEDILWIPQMKWPITRPDGSGEALGLRIHLDGRVNGVPTYRMCCTTVEGEFCVCHFGPKDDKANQQTAYSEEGQKKELRMVRALATAHAGPGWSVQRHPQLPDFFLTVGDWGFKIWKLGVTYPIIASPMGEYQMLCGRWSPTRASVVVVGTSDGFIQVWDLLDRSHEPTLFHRLSSDAISVLEFKPYAEKKPVAANAPANPNAINQLLVVGTKVGTFHLFDLPKVLVKGQTHELRQMKQLLDREVRRVAYFSWRWKERQKEMDRLVQEKAEPAGAGSGGAAASAPTKAKDDDLAEEDVDFMYDAEADAAFLAKVEAFGKEEDEFTDEQASTE